MPRVLLTGGSGFIAAHVLDCLLDRGHSVVTTVRSKSKAQDIAEAHPLVAKDRLDFAIVEDIAKPGAFDEAVVSDPPFEIVIHTASPFHYNVTNVKKDLLDPAIIGTNGILQAIKKSAPHVKRVVITSSFAAMVNSSNPAGHVYSEADWNSVTEGEAEKDASTGYRASKTFAERAAWDFMEQEKPNFSLATCNPPFVFGPVVPYLRSLDSVNTSNQRIRDLISGAYKEKLPPTGIFFWVDVRDLAVAHVLAAEKPEAAGQRFFIIAGYFSNKEVTEIVRERFPALADKLPTGEALVPGDYPTVRPGYDHSRAVKVLGVSFRSLEECIVDVVKSLQAIGA